MKLESKRSTWFGLLGLLGILTVTVIVLAVLLATGDSWIDRCDNGKIPDWQKVFISDSGADRYRHNAVTSDSAVCSTIGDFVLNALNGNAVDAAVATCLCAGASNFHSAGIGGGSFMVYYSAKSKSAESLDFRETAPAAAHRDMYNSLAANASLHGGLAVAIPQEVAGLSFAHSRYGRLSWRQVVTPVAQLLRAGQIVNLPLAHALESYSSRVPNSPPFDSLYAWMRNPATGEPYKAGEELKDALLADTMEEIANDPSAFYNGSLADRILRELRAAGSVITKEDLASVRPRLSKTLTSQLQSRRLQLYTLPPPSSGAILAFILNIFDSFNPQPTVKDSLNDYATFIHRNVEAFKFAYAKRSALGDIEFENVAELVANLTSDSFADEIRQRITDDATHEVDFYGPSFDWKEDAGTTHVSVVDSEGNAVAVTSTINTYFGSLVRGNLTGIIYNNEMDDFSIPNRTNVFGVPPSPSNFIKPKKKPMSSMAPVVVTDENGRVVYVSGASGGTRITTAIAYNLVRQIFLNETVKEAADAFRPHHQLVPNAIRYNPDKLPIPKEIVDALKRKGHALKPMTQYSVVGGIQRLQSGILLANSDFRKPSKTGGI